MSERERLPEVRVTARALPDAPAPGSGSFAVGSMLWRDGRGQLVCTIVAKAAFRLEAGATAPMDNGVPLAREEVHEDDDGTRTVLRPCDLVPFKPSAEVVVVGSTSASPASQAAVVARVVVGSVDKSMPVFPPRLSLRDDVPALGPAERAWVERPTATPLPPTFPARYFQAAPTDQWLDDEIAANESFILEGLRPEHPRMVVHLAGVVPRAFVAGESPLRLAADLLFIDTDRGICTLTFRGQIPLGDGVRVLNVTVIGAPPHVSLSADVVGRLELDEDQTMPIQVVPPSVARALESSSHDPLGTLEIVPPVDPAVASRPVLPFIQAPEPVDDGATAPRHWSDDDETPAAGQPTLPQPDPLPFVAPAWVPAAPAEVPSFLRAAPIETFAVPPSPPPLIASEPAPSPAPAGPEPPPHPPIEATLDSEQDAADDALPIEKYQAPRCGGIAGRLAMRPDERDAILEDASLAPVTWERLDAHWLEAIKDEMGRGKKTLLSEYDAAFVAALEAERGPITAAEYARLVVAIERGSAARTLDDLRLPPDATMRLRRVFLERTAKDQAFAREVRAAMRDAAR